MRDILSSSRYFANNSSTKRKNELSGTQSSSRMMPSSSFSKNQSILPDTFRPQPRFSSRKSVLTSHSQSTSPTIFLTSSHRSDSPDRFTRGPSAAIYNTPGRAILIASNTCLVVSGRLNTRNNTGDTVLYASFTPVILYFGFDQPIKRSTPIVFIETRFGKLS